MGREGPALPVDDLAEAAGHIAGRLERREERSRVLGPIFNIGNFIFHVVLKV